jgi:DNA-binding response OmpR family regulator
MEPVDGVEFTRRVRNGSDPRLVRLPIIMMTGHSELRRIVDARDAGVNEIVVKPLTAKAVLSRIEAVTQRPRPFVRTISYFGPDRRRRDDPKFAHLRRRQSDGRRERPDDARASGEIKAP